MRKLLLTAACAAVFASPAYGQTEDICAHVDDCPDGPIIPVPLLQTEIVVVGQRIGYALRDEITAPVSVIGEQEIAAIGSAFLADLLRTIPGVSINRSGPAGGLTQLRLRGAEANHVLVLVDGVEVSNPNTGEFDFASLRAGDVIKIEVLRGEQSALWGADAVGGVVNIITRSGVTDESYSLSLEAGSFGAVEGQVSGVIPLSVAQSGASISINGNAFHTDGYDVSDISGSGGGGRDGAQSRSLNVGLNGVKMGGVSFKAQYASIRAISEFDADTDFDGRLDDTLSQTKTDTQTARLSAMFDAGGIKNLISFSLSDTGQSTKGTSFSNDTTGKRTQLNWAAEKTWDHHNLTILGEIEKEQFSNFGGIGAGQNQDESIQSRALAADYRFNKYTITLSASARADFNDRFDNSQTWRIGAGYAFDKLDGRVRASIGTGVKNPSMTELFGFFPAFFVGNQDLVPETSLGYNIGYDQDWRDWKFSVDYFRSDLKDEIFTDFGAFPSTARNRTSKSKREGVEFEARGSMGDRLDIRASATFLDAQENGVKELRRPEFLASATATWTPIEPLSLTLSADHTGAQIDTDFATFSRVTLDDFTLVGLNIRYNLNDVVTLSLRGENLLNKDYQEVVGYASQDRGVYAGIRANF